MLFWCPFSTLAQEKHRLELNCTDKGNTALFELVSIPDDFSTKEAITLFLKTIVVESLQGKGYLAISVDSMVVEQYVTKAWIFLGDQYKWGEFIADSSILVVESMKRNVNHPKPGEMLNMASIALLKETVLRNFEENGYPFAAIQLDSSYFRGNELCARLRAIKGPLYRIDSLHVEGRQFIKKAFLQQYLSLGAGEIYRKSNLDALSGRLLSLGFVKESRILPSWVMEPPSTSISSLNKAAGLTCWQA